MPKGEPSSPGLRSRSTALTAWQGIHCDVAYLELTGIHPLGRQGKQVTEKWFNRGTRVHNRHSRDARGSGWYLDAAPASTHDRSLALQKHPCCRGCRMVKARALQETSTSRVFRAAGVMCWKSREGKLLLPPVSLQNALPTMLNIMPAKEEHSESWSIFTERAREGESGPERQQTDTQHRPYRKQLQ